MTNSSNEMSFRTVFLLGINSIIGSGIFLLPGNIYANLHNWSIAVILVAALASFAILLCFANLSSKFSGDGSSWIYTYNAYGRFAGFEVGFDTWVTAIIQLASEVAALLTTLKLLLPIMNDKIIYNIVAVSIVICLGIINLFGDHVLSIADNIASTTKIIMLISIIVCGAFFIHSHNFNNPVDFSQIGLTGTYHRINNSLSVIMAIFTGFAFIPVAASNMKNSEKTLPKVLVAVMITTSSLYLMIQSVTIGLLGKSIQSSPIPAASAFHVILGSYGYYFTLIGLIISTFGVALSLSFNAPVVASSLASEHQLLPSFIAKKNRFGASYIAILVSVVVASCLLLSGSYLFLVSCVVITSFIQYIPTILAVFKFRTRKNQPSTAFSLPGGMFIPSLALLASFYLMFSFSLQITLIGIGILVLGAILYLLDDHKGQKIHSKIPVNNSLSFIKSIK
ncbi:APC family permease [Furfurilactobacillus entadae]|uniref:APC family permease n=1 Tax=Furfurilactobacillus entadae TaxID=2922307 RepID=UPI0035EC4020